ncbi:hypothetical protein AB0O20_06420 [Streptomyces kronopolitis]|uniref:hypothetical protein n=1 Tax=Streptomyces kronopolitis TaxID=1612435 RepID=UPI00343479CA
MTTTFFTVLADTEDVAVEQLSRMCRLLDLEPLGAPKAVLGRDRWLARAVPAEQPDEDSQ